MLPTTFCRVALPLAVLATAPQAQETTAGRTPPPWRSAADLGGGAVWVGDAAPWVRKLLAAPRVIALLESPSLADLVPQLQGVTAKGMEQQFGAIEPYLPREVLLGMDPAWIDNTVRLSRILVAGLHLAAGGADDDLRQRIVDLLGSLEPMPMTARVTFRDERTAEQLFESLADALADTPPFVQAEEADDRLTLRVDVGDALASTDLRDRLRQFARDDAELDGWFAAVADLELHYAVSLDGAAIAVTTPGTEPQKSSLSEALWSDGPAWAATPLVHGAWTADPEPLLDLEIEVYDFLSGVDDVDALPPGIFDALNRLVDNLCATAAHGEAVVHVGDGISVRMVEDFDEDGVEEWMAEDWAVNALARGDFAAGAVSPTLPLDMLLSSYLAEIDAQLAQLAERQKASAAIDWFRWEAVVAMEEFIHGEESAIFAPGCALVIDRGDPVARLARGEVAWDGGGAHPLALAFVGRPGDMDASEAFVARFAQGLHQMAGGDGAVALGAGPTLVVDGREIATWSLPLGGSRLAPDPVPDSHLVIAAAHDGWLVLSSGRELAARVFSALATGSPTPAELPDGQLATSQWFGGLAPLAADLGALRAAAETQGFAPFAAALGWDRSDVATARTALRMSETTCLVLSPFEGRMDLAVDGDRLTTTWWIRGAGAGAK